MLGYTTVVYEIINLTYFQKREKEALKENPTTLSLFAAQATFLMLISVNLFMPINHLKALLKNQVDCHRAETFFS